MPQKITSPFPQHHVELANFANALSHPARIAIVVFLMEHGDRCCGQIVDALPMAQPTVSRHLRELVAAGLLNSRPCGVKVCYSLRHERIKEFCAAFQTILNRNPAVEAVS